MSRLIFVLVIAFAFTINESHGRMDCSGLYNKKSTNIFEQYINSCPRLLGSSEDAYCCIDPIQETVVCCNATEYYTSFGIIGLILFVAIFFIASIIVSCICCVCCSCCPWYKKRHGGTIYSRRTIA